MTQNNHSEDFNPAICEQRHKSISFRVNILVTAMGLYLTASVIAISYMAVAYNKAQEVGSDMKMLKVKQENDNREAMAEIARAQVRADDRLATAIEKMGYERNAQLRDISYKIDGMDKKIDAIQKSNKENP